MIYVVIVLYMAMVFIIGIIASRRVKDSNDFYLGGKEFGPWTTAFKFASTWESGAKLVGSPGQAYSAGMTAFLQGLTSPLAYLMSFKVFGPRLKTACDFFKTITTPEMLGRRYKSSAVHTIAAIALFIGMMGTLMGQYKSIGEVVGVVLGMDYIPALIISVVIVGIYTIAGGYRASVWTDVVQGICMVGGSVLIFIFTTSQVKNFSVPSLNAALMESWPSMLHITGGTTMTLLTLFTFLVIPLFMGIALPQQSVAIFSMKDRRVGNTSLIICTLFSTVLIWCLYLSAMAAKTLITVDNPDMIMPTLALTFLPKVVAGIFISAILAAIMSTVDGVLLVASSILTRDLMQRLMPEKYNASPVKWNRIATVIVVLIPLLLAIKPPTFVFWIISFAMSLTVFTFVMPMIGVVYWKRATKKAAIVQMIATTILMPLWVIIGQPLISGMALGIIIAPVIFITVTFLNKPDKIPEVDELWEKYDELKKESVTVKA
ncbi:MAG: sodium:solute symporter family protein [Acetivibrionales bacterium]